MRRWAMIGSIVLGCGGLANSDPPAEEPARPVVASPASGGQSGLGGAGHEPEEDLLTPWDGPEPVTYGVDGQSCNELGAICAGLDCCAAPEVPALSFEVWWFTESPTVSLSTFQLDAFEVTVARWRAFVEQYEGPPPEGAATHPHISGTGWRAEWDQYLPVPGDEDPFSVQRDCFDEYDVTNSTAIGCVNWYEAFAFCAWDGRRLPTYWEYETVRTVAGTSSTPWGGDWKDVVCGDLYGDSPTFPTCDEIEGPGEVGRFPEGIGAWGQYDIRSNHTHEWLVNPTRYNPRPYYPEGHLQDPFLYVPNTTLRETADPWDEVEATERGARRGFRCAGPVL